MAHSRQLMVVAAVVAACFEDLVLPKAKETVGTAAAAAHSAATAGVAVAAGSMAAAVAAASVLGGTLDRLSSSVDSQNQDLLDTVPVLCILSVPRGRPPFRPWSAVRMSVEVVGRAAAQKSSSAVRSLCL
jgi:hypothetical protein